MSIKFISIPDSAFGNRDPAAAPRSISDREYFRNSVLMDKTRATPSAYVFPVL